jgi:hypothetical protein
VLGLGSRVSKAIDIFENPVLVVGYEFLLCLRESKANYYSE